MTNWEKYEVPDWVVDDYNSRVSEEDRLPLGSNVTHKNDFDSPVGSSNGYYKKEKIGKTYPAEDSFDKFCRWVILITVGIFLAVCIWASI